MKYYLIFVCTLFVFSVSPAQPPGYMGKRFTLSYEQLAGPNFFELIKLDNIQRDNISSHTISESNAKWNYTGTISLDYVVGKTKSRGISISLIDQTMYFNDYTVDTIYSYGNYYNIYQNDFINNAKLTGFTIGAYVKYYKVKNIAPLGEYYKLELLYSSYQINSIDKKGDLSDLAKPNLEPVSTIGFAITFGKNRIIWDNIVISAGLTTGFRLGFFTSAFKNHNNQTGSGAFNDLKKDAQFWHGQNLFYNLHLGVGWLLF